MAVVAKDVPGSHRPPPNRLRGVLHLMRKEWTAYLFISPTLILFGIFTVFGLLYSFYLSFQEWNILDPNKIFVGLENYQRLLTDKRFHQAVFNTVYYTAA